MSLVTGGMGSRLLITGGMGGAEAPVAVAVGGDLSPGAFAELVFDDSEEMLELLNKGDDVAAIVTMMLEADEWN